MADNIQNKTKRIAKNTVLLYLRSLVSLFISLYASRLVLKGLGVDDYGTYGVVGGFVSMFSIVTSSLRGAISRFMNYAIGKEDVEEQRNTFALSLNIMVILAIIVIVLTETFGLWFLNNRMNIPVGRETAAFWCFQFSVLASVSGFLTIPYTASIIAHERMDVFAYMDVGEVVLKFFIAILITLSIGDVDKLILYAALLLAVALIKQEITRFYGRRHFEECRFRWYWGKEKFLEMFSFAGWTFLGNTSGTFSGQGVNMVMNVVFGTAVNAARSLAGTVINAVQIFVNNFTMAIYPQMTQAYAAEDFGYMRQLLYRGAKFCYYIMWLIVLPLVLEADFVVGLWLGEYPDHTIKFIRLSLIANTVGVIEALLGMGVKASGKVKWYQLIYSIFEFIYFGVVYVLMHNGLAPEWAYICTIFVVVFKIYVAWVLCRKYVGLSAKEYVTKVLSRILIVTVLSAILPCFLYFSMSPGWARFITVVATSMLSSGVCILYVGCSPEERVMLLSMIVSKIKRQ